MTDTNIKIHTYVTWALTIVISFFVCLAPVIAHAESISLFDSDIELSQDGSFTVTETIVYDFEEENRHGIFRFITTQHPQEASAFYKERYIKLDVLAVTQDGGEIPYEVSDSLGELEVKIGDPDVFVTGEHTYEISYRVQGGLSYFDDATAEIYWNVTGNAWEIPIKLVTAKLFTDGIQILQNNACYTGEHGETDACEIRTQADTIVFEATDLEPGSGLTVAQHIDGEHVEQVILERFNTVMLVLILLPLVIISVIVFAYRYQTKFKTGNPIIAQYEPYPHLKPMYSGMLFDGRLDPRDITAGIVYLAEQGFIKIKKTEQKVLFMFEVDDYEVELLRSLSEIESDFLRDVIELLFPNSSSVGARISLSELKGDTTQQQENYKLVQKLKKDIKKDMREQGFYQVNTAAFKPLLGFGLVTLLYMGVSLAIGVLFSEAIFVGLIFLFLVGICIGVIMYERRTRIGYEVQDHLKGFKLFLSVTDEERYAFHNAPQKSPEQFMQYLPYAIAFGVEKKWAEVFKNITIPNPAWYDGGGVSTFSAVQLSTSLGAFSTSFAASSGSSSSGGSSGGGFSGGGGGGGGGGSW